MLPVRVVSTSIRYRDRAGAEVQLANPGIHHRNETLAGLADPMVLGSVGASLGSVQVTARGGLAIPLGHTEPDPFVLGDMGLAHEHIQRGTGTVNPVLSVDAGRSWGPWRFGGFAFTQQVVYANGKGYQAGDRYAGGITLRRQLGAAWGVRGGIEVQGETAERWGGKLHDEGNRGRLDGMLALGGSWAATSALSIDLGVKLPVITHVVGGQLAIPAIAEVGVSWSFGGGGNATTHDHADDDHDHHDHDHGTAGAPPHVDTTGLDIAELGAPGAAVDLHPVAGKLTIFDFGAAWCEPCKILEPALVELARAHPDVVAIRRIDVVDWDSPAAARYLTPGGFNLPHLKIYDPTGHLVLERSSASGQLAALIDAVRKLVEAADPRPPDPPASTPLPVPSLRIDIVVGEQGFEPRDLKVPVGRPVTLRFERTTDRTCGTEVILELDGKTIVKDLPLNRPVELTLTFSKPGVTPYACAMNMVRGTITAQ